MSSTGSTYKPSEHDGLTKSGEPDKRTNPEHGFGGDRERASEAGQAGGHASGGSGGEKYKPSEHDGLKKDGTEDERTKSSHGFGADPEEASRQGQKGGSK